VRGLVKKGLAFTRGAPGADEAVMGLTEAGQEKGRELFGDDNDSKCG